MGLIILEAMGALLILIGIVWWTMFSGRKNGELRGESGRAPSPAAKSVLPAPVPAAPPKTDSEP